jgi:hypothetical protein
MPGVAQACTTFVLKTPQGTFFGKNYDFTVGYGMLVTNLRGVAKRAALAPSAGEPALWGTEASRSTNAAASSRTAA